MGLTRNKTRRALLWLASIALSPLLTGLFGSDAGLGLSARQDVSLPEPRRESDISVEEAIANRRSRREYRSAALTIADVGQLLWAAQGVTAPDSGYRAAPSAGATYPLEVYVVIGSDGVRDLSPGVYQYQPASHSISRVHSGDVQTELRQATLDQEWVGSGAIDVVVTGVDERTTQRYGDRGRLRYVPMEAGHAGENLALQAEALGLSTVSVGAFRDRKVRTVVDAGDAERPLYVFPVGPRQ